MKQLPIALAILLLGGCGGAARQAAEERVSASQAYEQANQAFESGDYEAAKTSYEQALSTGRLYGDFVSAALVRQALCTAELGDLAAADAALKELQQGAPNLDEVLAARSYVLEKQGNQKAAKAAWAKARRINRTVKKFKK